MDPRRSADSPRPPPLAGVRVLDLSRLLPGPLCAQHLADLGAEVIKVEDPKVGDYVRPAIRRLANRGKAGLTLDLKSAEGHAIFLRLLDEADVVLESFRPGVMQRLGLGYETLRERRRRSCIAPSPGTGRRGRGAISPATTSTISPRAACSTRRAARARRR
jgi:crotonobetainyl-CoA:carnitine CoA-transferase CaiB-like acyl-CoA transferase